MDLFGNSPIGRTIARYLAKRGKSGETVFSATTLRRFLVDARFPDADVVEALTGWRLHYFEDVPGSSIDSFFCLNAGGAAAVEDLSRDELK